MTGTGLNTHTLEGTVLTLAATKKNFNDVTNSNLVYMLQYIDSIHFNVLTPKISYPFYNRKVAVFI